MEKGGVGLLTCLTGLVIVVLLVLYQEGAGRGERQKDRTHSFQAALGGMGMGAVTVPAWNFGDFDPRLQSTGFDRIYPIPGGYSYSPDRLTMVSSFGDR